MIIVSDYLIFSSGLPVELEQDIYLPERINLKIELFDKDNDKEAIVFNEEIGTDFIMFEPKTIIEITEKGIFFDSEGRFKMRKHILFKDGKTGIRVFLGDRRIFAGFVMGIQ